VKGKATYLAYALTADWHERRACWKLRDAENAWKHGEGGMSTFPKKAIAQAAPDEITADAAEKAGAVATMEFDVSVHLSRGAGKKKDFGVILVGPAPEASVSPHSRETKEEKLRPRLEITYELK